MASKCRVAAWLIAAATNEPGGRRDCCRSSCNCALRRRCTRRAMCSIRPGETAGPGRLAARSPGRGSAPACRTVPIANVLAPLAELATDAAADVAAAGKQRDAGRAIDGLEPAYDGEQLHAARAGFGAPSRQPMSRSSPSTDCSDELPTRRAARSGKLPCRAKSEAGSVHQQVCRQLRIGVVRLARFRTVGPIPVWANSSWPTSVASRSASNEADQFVLSAIARDRIKVRSKNAGSVRAQRRWRFCNLESGMLDGVSHERDCRAGGSSANRTCYAAVVVGIIVHCGPIARCRIRNFDIRLT